MTGRPSLNLLVAITASALLGRGRVADGVAGIPTLARGVAATGYRGYTGAESR